jgi:hypothetical protein
MTPVSFGKGSHKNAGTSHEKYEVKVADPSLPYLPALHIFFIGEGVKESDCCMDAPEEPNPAAKVAGKRGPRMNVPPSVWGRSAWTFLHAAAYAYPQSDPKPRHIEAFKSLIQSLLHTLPCRDCRKNLGTELGTAKMTALDTALSTGSEALGVWLNDLNQKVSKRLGKQDADLDWKPRLKQLGIVGGSGEAHAASKVHTDANTSKEEHKDEKKEEKKELPDDKIEHIVEEPECTVVNIISGDEWWGGQEEQEIIKPSRKSKRGLIITPWLLLAAITLFIIIFIWVKKKWFSEVATLPPLEK